MRNRPLKGLCLLTALAYAALMACSKEVVHQPIQPQKIEVGQPFPNLLLPDLDGKPASVADWRGQKLILHIFASW